MAAAREGLRGKRLRELRVQPALGIGARYAYVSLVGRTEAPVMRLFRDLVNQQLQQATAEV